MKRKKKRLSIPSTLAFVVATGLSGCGSSTTEDASVADSGVVADAGVDAGQDAGMDAGAPDMGFDAGTPDAGDMGPIA